MKTIVVNLFGAPGAGKSTGAAYNIEYRYVNGDESNYRFIADEIIKLVKTRKE